MSDVLVEVTVDADGGGLLGAVVRVLRDGRIQVETDEDAWTLSIDDSRRIAGSVQTAEVDEA